MEHSQGLEARTAVRALEQMITLGGRLSRRALLISLAAGVVAGLYLGWSLLVAGGLAPLILALAPCAAIMIGDDDKEV